MPTSPAYEHRPLPAAEARASAAFAIPPRTLLLVEDSRLAAEAVRLICRRAGIRLRRADSLAAAAQHLRLYRPDIAMIDLGLPDGSGLDLIAALARSPLRPRRLVAVSGDAGLEGAALAAGAQAFLLKPVSLERHLSVMTGEAEGIAAAGVSDWPTSWKDPRERNADSDPLALRDDLRRVDALLADPATSPEAPERLRYAGQFLASVGRTLHDTALAEAAEAAGRKGDRGSLVALVQARSAKTPLL
ncbi:MAG: response regulator [Pararhodobacter sp.]